jgi:two-component system chemotaxis response regulator CheB
MMEERKYLLASMAAHGGTQWSAQQQERLADLQRHVNRMREFMLNGAYKQRGASPDEPEANQ